MGLKPSKVPPDSMVDKYLSQVRVTKERLVEDIGSATKMSERTAKKLKGGERCVRATALKVPTERRRQASGTRGTRPTLRTRDT
eukprot:gene23536-9767_t